MSNEQTIKRLRRLRTLNSYPTLPFYKYVWETEVDQYPPTGPAGISYFRGDIDNDIWVDCLLYRTMSGNLVGILNYYPVANDEERMGNFNIFVHPDFKRIGIGSELLTEALQRWKINLLQQTYTPEGRDFIIAWLATSEKTDISKP